MNTARKRNIEQLASEQDHFTGAMRMNTQIAFRNAIMTVASISNRPLHLDDYHRWAERQFSLLCRLYQWK